MSKLCGSRVSVDLALAEGRVSDFAHEVKACALGRASPWVRARHASGSPRDELPPPPPPRRARLKEEGEPPQGKWADLEAFLPVRDFKARHASTLLTFDAVVAALDQLENRETP